MLAVHTRNMNYYVNDKFYYLTLKQIIYLIQKYIKSYFATLRAISFFKFNKRKIFSVTDIIIICRINLIYFLKNRSHIQNNF